MLEHETDIINFRRALQSGEADPKDSSQAQKLGTAANPFQKETKRHKMKKLDLFTAEVVNFKFQNEF